MSFALPAVPLFALNTLKDAPKFKAKSMDGATFTNESVKGKPLLIQFWATWCQYCRRDQPALDALTREFEGKLLVLGVDVGESKKTVQNHLDQFPRSSKVVLTMDTNLAAVMEATAYPFYVLIDSDGKMVGDQRGAGGESSLRRLLKKVDLIDGAVGDDAGDDHLQSSPVPR